MSKDSPTREEMFIGQAFAGLLAGREPFAYRECREEKILIGEAKRLGECMEAKMAENEGRYIH